MGLFIIAISSSLQAAIMETNGSDLCTVSTWTSITVADQALQYMDVCREVLKKPGELIPIQTHVKNKTTGTFQVVSSRIADIGLIYNKSEKTIDVVKDKVMNMETKFNPFLIFVVVAVFFMVISNFLSIKKDRKNIRILVLLLSASLPSLGCSPPSLPL